MTLNVNLGTPYESIMESIIKKGYAGNQTEVIRQALTLYQRHIEEEEVRLVNKAIDIEMARLDSGNVKTTSFSVIKKKYGK